MKAGLGCARVSLPHRAGAASFLNPETHPMRTVKPRSSPTTLAELVLDLDDRSDGDEAGDLLIPAEEWAALCARAVVETERRDFAEELAAPTKPQPEKKAPPVGGLCQGFADCCRKLTRAQLERGDEVCPRCRAARLAIDAGEATSAHDYDAKKKAAKRKRMPIVDAPPDVAAPEATP